MFLRKLLPKTLILLHFFLGGPLFCFLFFCFCSFKAFLSLGGPFSYISDFFRPRPEPQSRGPLMFLHNFLPKTLLFYIFSSGAPCFVSYSFVFALLSLFCLSGAPFLILLRPVCLSGAPFLVYTFFSGHALSPKVGGPYVFAQFSAKNTYSFTFFSSGAPCFVSCSFAFALLSLFVSRGPLFLYF